MVQANTRQPPIMFHVLIVVLMLVIVPASQLASVIKAIFASPWHATHAKQVLLKIKLEMKHARRVLLVLMRVRVLERSSASKRSQVPARP